MTNAAKTMEIANTVLRQVMNEKIEREWVDLTDEEISRKYVDHARLYTESLQASWKEAMDKVTANVSKDWFKQEKKNMNCEIAINLNGVVVEVVTHPERIQFEKGDQFEAEMANKQKVIVDDKVITTAEDRRQWMHRKLDAWIDGIEE